MTLINRNGLIANDPWRWLADEDEAPDSGDIVVSFARYKQERGVLAARAGRLGVRIAPADRVEDIADQLGPLSLIEIAFPGFRDGRGFSTARLLRDRFKFDGELRAVGDVLEDQVFYLLRSGFHSFDLKAKDALAAFTRASGSFTAAYQTASDALTPVHRLRAERAARREAAE